MIGSVGLLTMTNNHSVKIHLDRELPIPLHWQNNGQITNTVVYAELGFVPPLPRTKADRLYLKYPWLLLIALIEKWLETGHLPAKAMSIIIYSNQFLQREHL